MVIVLMLAAAAAQPSPEALRLGRQMAESGTLASLLPMIQQKETEELVAEQKDLSDAERTQLRATAKRVYDAGRDRLMSAEAEAYARRLSVSDLRAGVAFQTSGAGRRARAAMPAIIGDTMQRIGTMDFKGDVRAAYCKETGKLCAK
jgi:hypothetical protein